MKGEVQRRLRNLRLMYAFLWFPSYYSSGSTKIPIGKTRFLTITFVLRAFADYSLFSPPFAFCDYQDLSSVESLLV